LGGVEVGGSFHFERGGHVTKLRETFCRGEPTLERREEKKGTTDRTATQSRTKRIQRPSSEGQGEEEYIVKVTKGPFERADMEKTGALGLYRKKIAKDRRDDCKRDGLGSQKRNAGHFIIREKR